MGRKVATAALVIVALVASLAVVELGLRAMGRVRNVGPSFTEFDPVYGKWLKRDATIRRTTPEFTMTLVTNAQGFRGPDLPEKVSRSIVFTGDSFTMGYGVDQGQDFPSLVRKALMEIDGDHTPTVINTGVGNTGNGRTLRWLQQDAERYHPALVVIQLTGNDFEDNLEEGMLSLGEDRQLQQLSPHDPGTARSVQAVIDDVPFLAELHLVGFAREVVQTLRQFRDIADNGNIPNSNKSASSEDPGELTYAAVRAILSLCHERGWPALGMAVDVEEPRLTRLRALFDEDRTDLIVIPLKTARPDLYYVQDGHWNEQGQAYAAGQVLDWLAGHPAILPPRP